MKERGFTFIEVVVVMAIFSFIFVVSIPFYTSFTAFNVVESYKQELLQNMRLAQISALGGKNDSAYGIYIENTRYTLYRGASYATRVQDEDRIYAFEDYIHVAGLNEINFEKKTGLPSTVGTVTLVHASNNREEVIAINSAGFIY